MLVSLGFQLMILLAQTGYIMPVYRINQYVNDNTDKENIASFLIVQQSIMCQSRYDYSLFLLFFTVFMLDAKCLVINYLSVVDKQKTQHDIKLYVKLLYDVVNYAKVCSRFSHIFLHYFNLLKIVLIANCVLLPCVL